MQLDRQADAKLCKTALPKAKEIHLCYESAQAAQLRSGTAQSAQLDNTCTGAYHGWHSGPTDEDIYAFYPWDHHVIRGTYCNAPCQTGDCCVLGTTGETPSLFVPIDR